MLYGYDGIVGKKPPSITAEGDCLEASWRILWKQNVPLVSGALAVAMAAVSYFYAPWFSLAYVVLLIYGVPLVLYSLFFMPHQLTANFSNNNLNITIFNGVLLCRKYQLKFTSLRPHLFNGKTNRYGSQSLIVALGPKGAMILCAVEHLKPFLESTLRPFYNDEPV